MGRKRRGRRGGRGRAGAAPREEGVRVSPEAGPPAWAGVDTHKGTHTLALPDASLRVVGTWGFPADPAGYAALADRVGDASVPVGVEGAGSYGAGLVAYLEGRGFAVSEMLRPRRERRRRGKSDPIDAVAAARDLAGGEGLPPKRLEGPAGDLAWLLAAREQAVRRATALWNCLDGLLVHAPQPVRDAFAPLGAEGRMEAVLASEGGDACHVALRSVAAGWREARRAADALVAPIAALAREACPALLAAPGVGAVTAARLVVVAGSNPGRMGSEAAFAMLCGVAPVPASSGRTDRHRLNRGGDRRGNRAIHEIARTRMATDPATRAYVERKMAEGKGKRGAIRCLCRHIARQVYRLLTGPQEPLPDGAALAARRKGLGLSREEAARRLGTPSWRLRRAEAGQAFDAEVLRPYAALLDRLEAAAPPPAVNTPQAC